MSFPSNFLETSQANAATVARASGQRARCLRTPAVRGGAHGSPALELPGSGVSAVFLLLCYIIICMVICIYIKCTR